MIYAFNENTGAKALITKFPKDRLPAPWVGFETEQQMQTEFRNRGLKVAHYARLTQGIRRGGPPRTPPGQGKGGEKP